MDPCRFYAVNGTLIWDRLPMTVAFVSFFAAVVAERISLKAGMWLLPPLILTGIGSVAYWNLTEMHGRGDLRPYGYVQGYPLLGVPLLIGFFRPPTHAPWIFSPWVEFMSWPNCSNCSTGRFLILGIT
jgi:hypothetical protein